MWEGGKCGFEQVMLTPIIGETLEACRTCTFNVFRQVVNKQVFFGNEAKMFAHDLIDAWM